MANTTLDQVVWPFQLDPNGHVLVAPQDSDADIASCIATILLWPFGTHDLNPEFGTPEEAFLQGGPDLGEIRRALAINEPRATTTIALTDKALTDLIGTIRVGFAQNTGAST